MERIEHIWVQPQIAVSSLQAPFSPCQSPHQRTTSLSFQSFLWSLEKSLFHQARFECLQGIVCSFTPCRQHSRFLWFQGFCTPCDRCSMNGTRGCIWVSWWVWIDHALKVFFLSPASKPLLSPNEVSTTSRYQRGRWARGTLLFLFHAVSQKSFEWIESRHRTNFCTCHTP